MKNKQNSEYGVIVLLIITVVVFIGGIVLVLSLSKRQLHAEQLLELKRFDNSFNTPTQLVQFIDKYGIPYHLKGAIDLESFNEFQKLYIQVKNDKRTIDRNQNRITTFVNNLDKIEGLTLYINHQFDVDHGRSILDRPTYYYQARYGNQLIAVSSKRRLQSNSLLLGQFKYMGLMDVRMEYGETHSVQHWESVPEYSDQAERMLKLAEENEELKVILSEAETKLDSIYTALSAKYRPVISNKLTKLQ